MTPALPRIPLLDMHADVFMDIVRRRYEGEGAAGPELEARHLARIRRGGIVGAVLIDCRMAGEEANPVHLERFIETVKFELAAAGGRIFHILNAGDLRNAMDESKFAVIVGYEGLSAARGDLAWIRRLYFEAGMRVAALTHNDDNPFGGGSLGIRGGMVAARGRVARGRAEVSRPFGLTEKGREAVSLMNELGILIDMAHAGRATRRDILETSTRQVMLSHSSAAAVYDTGRNLSDDEMRQIADRGGLLGCMTSPAALAPLEDRSRHTLDRYMEHLMHMINAAGSEHVGLGLHFCEYLYTPEQYPPVKGLEDASRAYSIIEGLRAAGLTEDQVEGIAWKNFYRVFTQALRR